MWSTRQDSVDVFLHRRLSRDLRRKQSRILLLQLLCNTIFEYRHNGCVCLGDKHMPYKCETTSIEGFVQQIACSYLRHGYWWYVTGVVPTGKIRTESMRN